MCGLDQKVGKKVLHLLCVCREKVVKDLFVHLFVVAGQSIGDPPDELHVSI